MKIKEDKKGKDLTNRIIWMWTPIDNIKYQISNIKYQIFPRDYAVILQCPS